MRRREFISFLGTAAAAAWPRVARAQQPARMRRIGVLMSIDSDDPEGQNRLAAFLQGLQEFGWSVGRNIRIETRWGAGNRSLYRRYAGELVALAPDVIFAGGGVTVPSLIEATGTLPIVFTNASDPVGGGLVASLARPGGNVTGFALFEYGISGKWLELLKQIAPQVTRVAVARDPSGPGGPGQLGALQGAASPLGVELSPIDPRSPDQIERGITAFARQPNGGLIVPATGIAQVHRALIVRLATQHRLPSVFAFRTFVESGGLISYGPNLIEQYRQAAGYVDRILKGENPGDLPVQMPTKYETVLNLKAAKALGLQVPDIVRLRADEVIE